MHTAKQTGISILELMLVLALVALMAHLAMPATREFVMATQSKAIQSQLHNAIWHARSSAITQKQKVQLCGSIDQLNCHSDWSKGWIIRKLDDQFLLTTTSFEHPEMLLKWEGFQKNIVFEPSGIGLTTNGRFYLCRNKKIDWQLILNRQGRLRTSTSQENRQLDSKCS